MDDAGSTVGWPGGVEVLAEYIDGWRSGRAAAVRRNNWAYVGSGAHAVWLAVLAHVTARAVGHRGIEVFTRSGRQVTLDHNWLTLSA